MFYFAYVQLALGRLRTVHRRQKQMNRVVAITNPRNGWWLKFDLTVSQAYVIRRLFKPFEKIDQIKTPSYIHSHTSRNIMFPFNLDLSFNMTVSTWISHFIPWLIDQSIAGTAYLDITRTVMNFWERTTYQFALPVSFTFESVTCHDPRET